MNRRHDLEHCYPGWPREPNRGWVSRSRYKACDSFKYDWGNRFLCCNRGNGFVAEVRLSLSLARLTLNANTVSVDQDLVLRISPANRRVAIIHVHPRACISSRPAVSIVRHATAARVPLDVATTGRGDAKVKRRDDRVADTITSSTQSSLTSDVNVPTDGG